jgi:hypothetical protein
MKYFSFIILPFLSLILFSCYNNQPDHSPPAQGYDISRIYSIKSDGSGLKLIAAGSNFSLLPDGKLIYINNQKLYSCNSDGPDSVIISPANLNIYKYQFYLNGTEILFI